MTSLMPKTISDLSIAREPAFIELFLLMLECNGISSRSSDTDTITTFWICCWESEVLVLRASIII
jgi:hypothetical protein